MTAVPFVAGAGQLELVLRATLLIGAAWAAAAGLRRSGASAATRHIAWLLGIAALLAMPLLWWLAPPLPLPILRPEAAMAATAALSPGTAVAGAPESWEWNAILLVAYALGAAVLLLRFALCRRIVSRLWREAEPTRHAAWQDLLASLSREMRLSRPIELRIARGPVMPMTWGTLAPKLLLPAEACTWPADRRRLVLLHELAHVARRDSLGRSAASLACALYWFHPGVWFAARQMRIEQEHAADDRVLTTGAAAQSYALSLLHLARRMEERSPDFAAAMAGACQLEHRLVSITSPARRERPGPAFLFASTAIATLVTLAMSAAVPVSPSSSPRELVQSAPTFATIAAERVAPAEPRSGPEAQMPSRAESDAREEGHRSDASNRSEAATNLVPMPRMDPSASDLGGPQAAPPAQRVETVLQQSEPIGSYRGASPAYPRRLAAYGPQLPPRDEGQDADARIPELARHGGQGDPAHRGNAANAGDPEAAPARPSHSRAASWTRPVVSLLINQVFP